MDKIRKIEALIEEMRERLNTYLGEGAAPGKIQQLSEELDKLINEHCNLLNK